MCPLTSFLIFFRVVRKRKGRVVTPAAENHKSDENKDTKVGHRSPLLTW